MGACQRGAGLGARGAREKNAFNRFHRHRTSPVAAARAAGRSRVSRLLTVTPARPPRGAVKNIYSRYRSPPSPPSQVPQPAVLACHMCPLASALGRPRGRSRLASARLSSRVSGSPHTPFMRARCACARHASCVRGSPPRCCLVALSCAGPAMRPVRPPRETCGAHTPPTVRPRPPSPRA